MTTSTTITPPQSRLDSDLAAARAALGQAEKAAQLAGDGAHASSRVEIHCKTPAAVDLIAAEWGVTATWGPFGGHYFAEVVADGAAIEAVFSGECPAVPGNGSAA